MVFRGLDTLLDCVPGRFLSRLSMLIMRNTARLSGAGRSSGPIHKQLGFPDLLQDGGKHHLVLQRATVGSAGEQS